MIYKSPFGQLDPIPDVNAHDAIFNSPWASQIPDYTVYIDAATGKEWKKNQFIQRFVRLATALVADVKDGGLGLKPNSMDIIGIFSKNHMEFNTLCHALMMVTVPASLLSSFSTAGELEHLLKISRTNRLFVEPDLLPVALKAAAAVGIPKDRIHLVHGEASGIPISVESLIKSTQSLPVVKAYPAKKDTLAFLPFSSGTSSGFPKAVSLTHENVIAYGRSAIHVVLEMMKAAPPDPNQPAQIPVGLLALPLYHIYGFTNAVLRPFFLPLTIVIIPKFDLEETLRVVPKYKITALPLIPTILQRILDVAEARKVDFSSVQIMSSGAGYATPESFTKARKLFKNLMTKPINGYGLTETTAIAIGTSDLFPKSHEIAGSGVLIPGVEARIIGPDGKKDVKRGEKGELWLRGPTVVQEYFKDDKANKSTFVNGWLKTGDTFYVDKDEVFHFADRQKDTLKVSGMQVSPAELEQTIRDHPAQLVSEACVCGVPAAHKSNETVPRAWVVLSAEGKRSGKSKQEIASDLQKWVQERQSRYKWLKGGVDIVDEIPSNPTGKILKRVLIEEYVKGQAATAKSKL
ncbi:hypothetical protein FRB94_009723 [Tulasnella sp. JGI-2019a]|nr:hypothetical protein FRB93_001138 [Tulasnella sp. JGI-2019a]KAG9010816.1 hypothetical protein FRB94_009723 [Tulasnella sp. JGI-2019a]KAG9035675.1 hypothetical protein FRB95_010913 [Tulasnella sp. JGI-2019a]